MLYSYRVRLEGRGLSLPLHSLDPPDEPSTMHHEVATDGVDEAP